MKLKLKCQLEWNENDIKTEPTQSVTITTKAVKGHQQQQQKADACRPPALPLIAVVGVVEGYGGSS